jgi:hypothetical protein
VVKAAAKKSPELKEKYERMVREHLTRPEHRWMKGLTPEEAEALRRMYRERYDEGAGKRKDK